MNRMSNCKSCKAEIQWVKTKNGKSMPLDMNRIITVTLDGEMQTGYASHFSTCPNANKHRKKLIVSHET